MLIELDLNQAKDLGITANQFILITLLIEEIDIKSLLDVIPISESDISNLINKNILTEDSVLQDGDFSKLVISESFLNKVEKRDFFAEFYDEYPVYTKRPDGTKEYLRTNPTRCRRVYTNLVGKSQSKHEHMLKCLRYEVAKKSQEGKMSYMKKMPNWFSSEEWTAYEESMLEIESPKTEEAYGTAIE